MQTATRYQHEVLVGLADARGSEVVAAEGEEALPVVRASRKALKRPKKGSLSCLQAILGILPARITSSPFERQVRKTCRTSKNSEGSPAMLA